MKTTETALVKHLRETIRLMKREAEIRDMLIQEQKKLIQEQEKIIQEQESHIHELTEMIRELDTDTD